MTVLNLAIKQKLAFILVAVLVVSSHSTMANTDKKAMGDVQRAREQVKQKGMDHAKHLQQPVDPSMQFRGVYYGYLPCKDCAGIKMTLSLKNKKNYLLVTQYAQASNREFYEKGKYDWDDKSRIVTLVSRKDKSIRKLRIKNEGALIVLTSEGKPKKGDQDQYALLRSDKNKSRELHIH